MEYRNTVIASHLNRRRLISLLPAALYIPAPLYMSGCKAAPIAPQHVGTFTEISLVPPMRTSAYKSGYKEPVGRFKTQTIHFNGQPRKVHFHHPRNASTKPKAVLLMLHGSNRSGVSLLDKWRPISDRHNILLVAPDSLTKSNWSLKTDPMAFMQAAIDAISTKYGFEDAPLYGFGHSAGAIMMTRLSIRHGEAFTRVATHAGYIHSASAAQSKSFKIQKPPIAHFLGTKDHIFKVEPARQSAEILSQHGQDSQLITLKGHNHWYYDLAPFINKQAWSFLSEGAPKPAG